MTDKELREEGLKREEEFEALAEDEQKVEIFDL